MRCFGLAAAILTALVLAAPLASADAIDGTDFTATQTNSWDLYFSSTGVAYDWLAVEIVADGGAGPYRTTGINVDYAGWSAQIGGSGNLLALATGPDAPASTALTYYFDGDMGDTLTYRFSLYLNGTHVASGQHVWDGTGPKTAYTPLGSWTTQAAFEARMTAVPEPGTLGLLGLGLATIVVVRRRRRLAA